MGRMRTVHRWAGDPTDHSLPPSSPLALLLAGDPTGLISTLLLAGDPTLTTHFHPPPGYLPLSSLLQALLKKHEVVMADVEAFGATIASLEEQSKKCKVCHTTHMPHAPPHPLTHAAMVYLPPFSPSFRPPPQQTYRLLPSVPV